MILDNIEVKVGDHLWNMALGWATVQEVYDHGCMLLNEHSSLLCTNTGVLADYFSMQPRPRSWYWCKMPAPESVVPKEIQNRIQLGGVDNG